MLLRLQLCHGRGRHTFPFEYSNEIRARPPWCGGQPLVIGYSLTIHLFQLRWAPQWRRSHNGSPTHDHWQSWWVTCRNFGLAFSGFWVYNLLAVIFSIKSAILYPLEPAIPPLRHIIIACTYACEHAYVYLYNNVYSSPEVLLVVSDNWRDILILEPNEGDVISKKWLIRCYCLISFPIP